MSANNSLLSFGLWFDSDAEIAARFYTSLFPDSAIHNVIYYSKEGFEIHGREAGTVMAVDFRLAGTEFQAINGGPVFRPNPSVSFYINCKTSEEADKYWLALSADGTILMDIGSYDWSPKYGWLQDKYGVSWQIFTEDENDNRNMICPSIMFTGDQHAKAEEAMNFYVGVFDDSLIQYIYRYPGGGQDPEGTIMHAQFVLAGQEFKAMDSGMDHAFNFNEGVSIIVNCDNQTEIDEYWKRLLQDGGQESACGWLKDRFGLSWQVVPREMDKLFADHTSEQTMRATKAMFGMKKLDIARLKRAYEGR